jgi:hypothetical protein
MLRWKCQSRSSEVHSCQVKAGERDESVDEALSALVKGNSSRVFVSDLPFRQSSGRWR